MSTVFIENESGEVTTGEIEEPIISEVMTIFAKDENGMPFEATGRIIEIID